MPAVNNPSDVRTALQKALTNRIFSQKEATAVLRAIERDGVSRAEVNEVVETLTWALDPTSGEERRIDLTTAGRRAVLNGFLGALNAEQPLPLGIGPQGPSGSSPDYVRLLEGRATGAFTELQMQSFAGHGLGIDANGDLRVGDRRPLLHLADPNGTLLEGLWAMNRPTEVVAAAEAGKQQLTVRLARQIVATLADDAAAPRSFFLTHQAVTAALGALEQLRESWAPEVPELLLGVAGKLLTPLQVALCKRAVAGVAELTSEQQTQLDAIELPEGASHVLDAYDAVVAGRVRVSGFYLSGGAARYALEGLCFARHEGSVENLYETLRVWGKLQPRPSPGSAGPWDGVALSQMRESLAEYIDEYGQHSYLYGTLAADAVKKVASLTSARAVTLARPGLSGDPPNLDGFPLTSEQARYLEGIVDTVRDESAVGEMVRCLACAHGVLAGQMPSRWGYPARPSEPMSQAAFDLFTSAASSYLDRLSHSKDGKLPYDDLARELRQSLMPLHDTVQARLSELRREPPGWDGVSVSAEAADYLRSLLAERLRSEMTVDNIGRALRVVADARGGAIEGASFVELKGIIDDYIQGWPEARGLDFNKLERIATCAVQGRAVPLCSLNGETVRFAELYDGTARQVAASMDRTVLRHDWVADRWGNRARQALEILDVVAEQAVRGEGPIAKLNEAFANSSVEAHFTGLDGDHEQLIYVLTDPEGKVLRFNQGSDGVLAPYKASNVDPVLTALVDADGALHVRVAETIRNRRYPLQISYGVGDKIDLSWRDPDATESHDEGKPFDTRSRVVEAEILSYTAGGIYEVQYRTLKGATETRKVTASEIRRANNPHWFTLKGDWFSDVKINLSTDEALRTFVEEARPIFERHLPRDGSLATLSAAELTRRQKRCIADLLRYVSRRVKYPDDMDESPDEPSKRYHELTDQTARFPLGELVKIGRGVCRHMCILEHLLLQCAGIDSRLASGAANTSSADFRGFHIWLEVTLADGERFLSDQTWSDATIPLWAGAYSVDKRRIEMYYRTARYDRKIVWARVAGIS